MKKFYVNCNSPQRKFVWPGKMMKIFVLALVAACLSFSGRVMAQSQRVTLDLKSCSIIEFFRTLQEKDFPVFHLQHQRFAGIGQNQCQS